MALHCAATLLITRHGDVEDGPTGGCYDSLGSLTDLGAEQVRTLAASLAARNVAAVYTSRPPRAVESAALAAELLGVTVATVEGLEELGAGLPAGRRQDDQEVAGVIGAWAAGRLGARIPGGESGEEVLGRYREALQGIADLHRGETVLLFSHGGVMSFCLPRLADDVPDDLAGQRHLPNCATAELLVGDEGYQLISWPGSASQSAG